MLDGRGRGQGIQARKERPEETSKIRKIRGTGVGVPPKDGKHLGG